MSTPTVSEIRKLSRKMVKRRADIERRHDPEAVVASRVTIMARLNAMQERLADRCPACGEAAEHSELYTTAAGVVWRRCLTCFEKAPDRRGVPVPASVARALERLVSSGT